MPHFFEWFPSSRAEQLAMAIAWTHLFGSSSPLPFGIPLAEVQEFTNLTTTAETTLELAKSGERTPVITAQCREDFERRELMRPPTSGKELPHSRWMRRRRERFSFDGDSGKTVYFCIHYENSKGEAGEFGPIFSAVIP
jgi:hypothetical protein